MTLSDASQIMRSHDSLGRIENAFEDERIVYFAGNADCKLQRPRGTVLGGTFSS